MRQFSIDSLATLDVRIVLSPAAQRRRREARFRNALFNLRMINNEILRMEALLIDELVSDQQNHFAKMFFSMRENLDRMRFYLDCGSFDSKRIPSPRDGLQNLEVAPRM